MKELLATDLIPKTKVNVQFGNCIVPMLVSSIDIVGKTVCLYSQELGWRTENRYDQNGIMYNSMGYTIHLWEKAK